MKTAAIICEYNPFHGGHLLQIEKTRAILGDDTVIISLMSGSAVQRGQIAIYPKHKRAEAAVKCGSDLVLELPCPYCCSSAEFFAKGAVTLLERLGGIDFLCFGSENGELSELSAAAENLRSEEYLSALRSADSSESHQRNAEEIYRKMFGGIYPDKPNDILAVEYLSALSELKSAIKPITYKRLAGFSATESRTAILSGRSVSEMIPRRALEVFEGIKPTPEELYSSAALYKIRSSELSGYFGMNGGVAGCIKNNSDSVGSLSEIVSLSTSKKFSSARIRRAILSAMLGITEEDVREEPRATYLLAASSNGLSFLSMVKKTSGIAVITKNSERSRLSEEENRQIEFCRRADELFCLSRGEAPSEMIKKTPFILK